MGIKELKNAMEIVSTINEAGLTKNPIVHDLCQAFWDTQDVSFLEELLVDYPGIYEEALILLDEINYWIQQEPFRPYPAEYEVDKISGDLNVGYVNYNLDMAGINFTDITKGLFISGAMGTGKSYPCLRLLDQILSIPIEERGFNILVIQHLKKDANGFVKKYPETFRIIEWEDLRYNLWQVEDWDTPEDKLGSACKIFAGENFLYTLTVPILNFAAKKCYTINGVLNGSKQFPTFSDISGMAGTFANEFNVEGYEIRNSIGKLRNRLIEFIETGQVLNCRQGFPVSLFIENDICFNTHNTSEYLVRTTVMNILSDMLRYYDKNPLKETRLRTLIIIDEARWLFNVKRDQMDVPSNEIVEKWCTTSREAGIGKIIITQEPQSVSQFVTNNCNFSLTFKIFGEGIDKIKKLQNLTDEQTYYILKLAQYGEAIFRHPNFDRPFLVEIPSDLDLDKSISQEEITRIKQPFIDYLHKSILPRTKDATIKTAYTKEELEELKRQIRDKRRHILNILLDNPFTPLNALYKNVEGSQEKIKTALEWLENKQLITKVSCKTSKRRESTFYPLTQKAHDLVNTPQSKRKPSPERFKHTFYCKKVKDWIEKQGDEAILEYGPKGAESIQIEVNNKTILVPQRIDIFTEQNGKRTAYEVTLSFSNLKINVFKCFSKMNMDRMFIVCEDKDGILEAQRIISSSKTMPEKVKEKISYTQISDFL